MPVLDLEKLDVPMPAYWGEIVEACGTVTRVRLLYHVFSRSLRVAPKSERIIRIAEWIPISRQHAAKIAVSTEATAAQSLKYLEALGLLESRGNRQREYRLGPPATWERVASNGA